MTPPPAHPCLTEAPLSRPEAETLAGLFGALADRGRVRIVSALLHSPTGELCGRDLEQVLGLGQPTVSHHLRTLVRAGLVEREQRGPYAWFSLAPEAMARLRAIFA